MGFPMFVVDAFTDRPYSGNPAAVCLMPAWKDERWLQAVAGEMNLSESAFLVKTPEGDFWRKKLGKSKFLPTKRRQEAESSGSG